MDYPSTDHHAAAAIEAWRAGNPYGKQELDYPRTWLEPADQVRMTVAYVCTGPSEDPQLSAVVDDVRYSLDDPLPLEPVSIPKPWGREIWYSGIEARGESLVRGDGGSLSLASYLALAPERICRRSPIVLLKVLDPRPEPQLGELYLEVHEHKQEVYVVSAVDPSAWPDGRGRIRLGVDQQCRTRHGNDTAFRAAFLAAVEHYEGVRAATDAGRLADPQQEVEARAATTEYIAERTLEVGDVIQVPTWVPHSLQHGVRVIEFQTPAYERFIVSSAQKVLTQDHWDSRFAIEHMSLDEPPQPVLEPVADGIDRIARFDDFSVWRASRTSAGTFQLPDNPPFVVAICIHGAVELCGRSSNVMLNPGEAALIPARSVGCDIHVADDGIALFAGPGL